MPVSFWAEPDGSRLRADYFGDYQGWPERRLDQGHLPRVVRRLRPQRLHPQPPRRPQGHRGLPRRRRGLRRGRRLVGDRHPARRARMRGLSTSNEPVRAAGRCAGGGPAVDWSLTFPDLPRLELDQLLGQVVARAREVLARHPGSVAGAVAGHPDGVRGSGVAGGVAADRGGGPGLVGARYAALGMIAPDGRLAEFVHIGMPEQAVKAIGHLPQGKGTIGGADRRSAADPAAPDQRGPALVGVPAGAPADDQLPRGADPGP